MDSNSKVPVLSMSKVYYGNSKLAFNRKKQLFNPFRVVDFLCPFLQFHWRLFMFKPFRLLAFESITENTININLS